jgi:hypothetical protein
MIHYYSERAKSELHLTDMKANTKMKVTARPYVQSNENNEKQSRPGRNKMT